MGDNTYTSDKAFSRDDLFLLMKSYENSVQQNTILLNQQQLMLQHQDELVKKQNEICSIIQTILDKLSNCSINVARVEVGIQKSIGLISETMSHETEKASLVMSNIISDQNTKMVENRSKCEEEHTGVISNFSKDHHGLSIKIYGLYGLLGGIIISLITLIIDLNKKIDVISEIAKCLGVN